MADVNIFALGGQDENGKDCYVIEINNDIYIVNSGIKIPINNLNGIDGIIPNFSYLMQRKNRIKGLFISNALDENFAAIPWMIMDLPGVEIFCSAYTKEVIKDRISKYQLGHNNFKITTLKSDQKIGEINVKSFDLAASIPGTIGLNFQTKNGDILFMSNFTIDNLDNFGNTNLNEIKKNSNDILAVLLDSRISNFKGHSADKKSIVPFVKDVFTRAKDNERIIVGAYDEDVYNIEEIINLAKKHKRPIITYGRTFDTIYTLLRKVDPTHPTDFESYKNISKLNNAVVLITGTWSRLYQRFVRIAHKNDVYMKFKETDNVIMLSPPINGMEVIYANSLDEVARIAPKITDVTDKDFYKLRPASHDIFDIVKTLKPKFFLPISGLYRYLIVASKIATKAGIRGDKNIVLQNGKILHIRDGQLVSRNKGIKNFGNVIIDGFGVGDVSYEIIKERKYLATGGLISISTQINRKTKQLLGEINIQIIGIVSKTDLAKAQTIVRNVVVTKVNEAKRFDYRELQNQIRRRVQKLILKTYDKEPLTVIAFYEV